MIKREAYTFLIIIYLFSNLVLCSDGSDGSQPIVCGGGEFCDFDHGVFGFCQSCSNVNGTCEDQDFNNEKGETECKMVCEGRSNYYKPLQIITNYTIKDGR